MAKKPTPDIDGTAGPKVDLDWLFKLVLEWNATENPSKPDYIDLEALPQQFSELRDAYDNFRSGNWLSLLDTLQICRDHNLALPNWANDGLTTFVIDAVSGSVQGGKGRSNNPAARTRESLKRHTRFETVRQIRIAQKWRAEDSNLIYAISLPNHTKAAINDGRVQDIGTTLDDAVAAAEVSLRGTFAQASFATIAKNFRTYVTDEFTVSHETQVALGLANDDLPPDFEGYSFHWPDKAASENDGGVK